MDGISWEKNTEEKFKQMIAKIPAVMRGIAEDTVKKKLVGILQGASRTEATEKDLVDAFFAATPGGFHGPMKCDMEDLGIDYTQYGYEKDDWKSIMGVKRDNKS